MPLGQHHAIPVGGLLALASELARFCDELQLFLVAPALPTLWPCYDFDPTAHPSSAQAYAYEYA
jgi:hypothetical protein